MGLSREAYKKKPSKVLIITIIIVKTMWTEQYMAKQYVQSPEEGKRSFLGLIYSPVVLGPTSSVSPENLLEIQMLSPSPMPTESETLRVALYSVL